jgi:Carboxypeptidase regulatory-like domain/TonB dependent receptor-like, beta-barrel
MTKVICSKGFVCLIVLLVAVGMANRSAAGQQNAGIIGQVVDESGAVLPGVTVTATSPALQVPSVTAVSDDKGEFRLTPLPIGTYTIEFTLTGFQTVRHEGVRLTVGFTARIDTPLKVGSLQESITVSGVSPVVDTTSTTATTEFTRETLEALPTSRNGVVSLLAQAPGVRGLRDVGGSTLNQVPVARVFGQSAEVYYTLEGVQTSSLQTSGGQSNYWDYTAIEEASVRTIGNSAEMPYRGVNLSAVVKSGGNNFHGTGSYNNTSADLQSDNIDEDLEAQGITSGGRLAARYSYNGDLGGRIVRDKLWFYGAARRMVDENEVLNTYKPDGSQAALYDMAWTHTEKLSYQMTPSNKVVGFHQYYHKYQLANLSQFRAWEYRGGLTTLIHTSKVEWQKVHGNSLVTSLQYGRYDYSSFRWTFSPQDVPPSIDQVTLIEKGPQTDIGQTSRGPRHHVKGTASWFRPDLFKGNHEFKFGGNYTDNWFGRQYLDQPLDLTHKGATLAAPQNYRLRFDNGAPFQLEVWNNWALAHVTVRYVDLYAQDSWTIGRRVTLNLGLRYAHDDGYVPESCRDAAVPPGNVSFPATCYPKKQFNTWNPVSPRLHAAWDVTGEGKTMIKGGWGRFDHARQLDPELAAADPQVRTTVTYRWRDPNGNKDYDPGEVNLDPNGGDFVSQSGGTNTEPNPNERDPVSDEFSVSLERELMANFALRVSGIYSKYTDVYRTANLRRPYETYNIPVTRLDPGPDGVLGNADDTGQSFTYWEYSPDLSGRRYELFTLTNDPDVNQTYKSMDLSVFKRLSNKWQLLASYSATKIHFPFMNTGAGTVTGQNVLGADRNPNAEFNTTDDTWEWTAKLSGVYQFPAQVMVSAQFEHSSGRPFAREVLFRGGRTIPSLAMNVEPFGTRRLPNVNQLDLRAEKNFTVHGQQKLGLRMNIFNALNTNTVLSLVRRSGPTFLLPQDIMPPRIAEFSVSYSF